MKKQNYYPRSRKYLLTFIEHLEFTIKQQITTCVPFTVGGTANKCSAILSFAVLRFANMNFILAAGWPAICAGITLDKSNKKKL